jgi:hypothetical protein
VRHLVDEAGVVAPGGTVAVDLDDERRAAVHRDRKRLGAAHPAESGGQGRRAGQRAAEMLARALRERLVRALDDPLGGDVDPAACGHLAVHREAGALELAELLPRRPVRNEVGVGDQDARHIGRGAEDANRLAALDEEGLVVGQPPELADDRVEGLPGAGGAPGAAVDDQVVRILGNLGVEVVHEHPQRRLLRPAAAGELRAARRADGAVRSGGGHQPMISRRSPGAKRPPAIM